MTRLSGFLVFGSILGSGAMRASDVFSQGILLQAEVAEPTSGLWKMISTSGPGPLIVIGILLCFSLLSFTIIFSKLGTLRRAKRMNREFLRIFRKSPRLDAAATVVETYRSAPLATLFQFGYSEVHRQVTARSTMTNWIALERSMQLGISEEISLLERNMIWLATTAAVCPFIGLLGTVFGIIDVFSALGTADGTGMRGVAPGIAAALYTTGLGLFAAIPAAIAYNYFSTSIKEIGQR
ncbi:MAG: MotA/TolQ/ExbB proton channel family protein, partial [Acidobacteriota bacterium]